MVVHFPLSLILVSAFLEVISIRDFHSKWRQSIEVMLWIGTLSAIISAGMGYLLAVKDGYEGSGVLLHQQFGILTAILSTICLALAIHSRQRKNAGWTFGYRIALFLTVVSLVLTGHFGASLTHGSDFLTEVLPGNSSNSVPDQYDIDLTAFLVDTGESGRSG